MTRLLVSLGINKYLFSSIGIHLFPLDVFSKFPLDYAKENNFVQIAQLLSEAQGEAWKDPWAILLAIGPLF